MAEVTVWFAPSVDSVTGGGVVGVPAALFGFGILNAGLFTATVLPLATAFIICEAFGLEAAVVLGALEIVA